MNNTGAWIVCEWWWEDELKKGRKKERKTINAERKTIRLIGAHTRYIEMEGEKILQGKKILNKLINDVDLQSQAFISLFIHTKKETIFYITHNPIWISSISSATDYELRQLIGTSKLL